MKEQLEGRNAVVEALKANRTIMEIRLLASAKDRVITEIKNLAAKRRVPVYPMERRELDAMAQTRNHQGVIALVNPYGYTSLDEVFERLDMTGQPILLVLDGIEDPHNLGAILRSGEALGASAAIIPKKRAVGVTPAVAKTASGALEHLPVAQVANLTETVKRLKKKGFWIAGGVGDEHRRLMDQDLTGPLVLVIGNEAKGISRLLKEECDYLVRIPLSGQTESLNASVAAGILLYEAFRQRSAKHETEATS